VVLYDVPPSRPAPTRIALASRAGGALLVTRKNYTRMLAHRPLSRAAGRRRLRDRRLGGGGVLMAGSAKPLLTPPLAKASLRELAAGMVAGGAGLPVHVRAHLLRPVHRHLGR
jgi:hypothetical protein